jgi:phosphohistidine phosphatase
MILFIVRHAIAEDRAPGLLDSERALTKKGKKRFARVVAGLPGAGVDIDVVLHSPWRRAVETAEMITFARRWRAEEALARAPDEALLDAIKDAGSHVAVVGHEPWLTELIAWLTTGERALGNRFELKKGAVAALDGAPSPGAMRLCALYPPRVWRP